MTCEKCGYEHVDVHRTSEGRATYCQQCGHTTEDRSDLQKQRWINRQELLKKKKSTAVTPVPEKRSRHGR